MSSKRSGSSRLFLSPRTHSFLTFATALASLLGIGGLFYWLSARPGAVGSSLVGLLVLFAILLLRLMAIAQSKENVCATCSRLQLAGELILQLNGIGLCSKCTASSSGAHASELLRRGRLRDWLFMAAWSLPTLAPHRISNAVFEEMTEHLNTPTDLRLAAGLASRVHNYAKAKELIDKIPVSDRIDYDWFVLGSYLSSLGEYERARASNARCDTPDKLLKDSQINNEVWFRLRGSSELSVEIANEMLIQIEEIIRRAVLHPREEGMATSSDYYTTTKAEILLRMGKPREAHRHLSSVERTLGSSVEFYLLAARIELACENNARALDLLRTAIEKAHPETLLAQEARDLLASLPKAD